MFVGGYFGGKREECEERKLIREFELERLRAQLRNKLNGDKLKAGNRNNDLANVCILSENRTTEVSEPVNKCRPLINPVVNKSVENSTSCDFEKKNCDPQRQEEKREKEREKGQERPERERAEGGGETEKERGRPKKEGRGRGGRGDPGERTNEGREEKDKKVRERERRRRRRDGKKRERRRKETERESGERVKPALNGEKG
ncbi:hypothetical protein TNCV_1821101 [Trichonephila clavipes]|nr:hypothetical protein TNCV_1821101 [Trichonephila clavipes]